MKFTDLFNDKRDRFALLCLIPYLPFFVLGAVFGIVILIAEVSIFTSFICKLFGF